MEIQPWMALRFWHNATNRSFVKRAGLLLLLAIASVERTPTPDVGTSPTSDGEINVHKPNLSCPTWNDGCRTCRRDAAGNVNCSNIGIACQPRPVTCNLN